MDESQAYATATRSEAKGQVHVVLGHQARELEELHQTIGVLEARLGIVTLARESPDPVGADVPREVLAPLAQTVDDHNSTLIGAHRRLQHLLDQLEI